MISRTVFANMPVMVVPGSTGIASQNKLPLDFASQDHI